MDQRFQEEFDKAPAVGKLEFIEIDDCGNLVFQQPPREQRRVAGIGRQLAASTYQQYIDRLTQTGKLTFIVQNDRLNPGALGNEPQQPRLAAARIGLNEKPGIDQHRQVELQLRATSDLPDL